MENKKKVILDCDPGHDDAVNILLAGRSPKLELLGITTVGGNQLLEKTTINALRVCQHLDIDVPVYQGCGQAMIRERVTSPEIHGESGLDGPVFAPLNRSAEKEHAVNYLTRTLMASDGDITLVPTGPLTNIAMAMRMEPKITSKIREIVLMGGCYQLGNVTPAAEFNICGCGCGFCGIPFRRAHRHGGTGCDEKGALLSGHRGPDACHRHESSPSVCRPDGVLQQDPEGSVWLGGRPAA